ncbi:uncharacterized protein LOC134815593 [Bolinopsis microptera]|uniref:uncharacterized protein LOC134815593 n=1 Tax=Bolinopsis microptera TaxID=2820187 RepID=UPI0030795F75
MDSDEDEIFEKSVFDNDAISKGDLVWAPLKVDDNGGNAMWPAKVTSVKGGEKVTVKMLGRQMKAITVEGCVPYVLNDEYEDKGKGLPLWDEAISLAKEIVDKETNGIIQTKLPSTPQPASSSTEDGRGKRRKLGSRTNMTGHVQGDIVWAKYRNHPVWPAKVTDIESGYLMIHYLVYGQHSIRTALRNISHFDCTDYVSNVEAGINSTLSAEFKKAFMIAYEEFTALNPNVELSITPLQLFSNGNHAPKEPVSPHKGKNQLVHFINKNEEMFLKIIQGKLVSHYHKEFKISKDTLNNGALFGSFAKTELEEERVVAAIGQMQAKFAKRYKLPQAYGLSVMLPEAIIRLVMFKQQLPYSKAKQVYQTDILKVKKGDRLKAREALLNTTISQEAKEEFEELSNLKLQKSLESHRGKGKIKRKR